MTLYRGPSKSYYLCRYIGGSFLWVFAFSCQSENQTTCSGVLKHGRITVGYGTIAGFSAITKRGINLSRIRTYGQRVL